MRYQEKEMFPVSTVWTPGMVMQGDPAVRTLCRSTQAAALPARNQGPMPRLWGSARYRRSTMSNPRNLAPQRRLESNLRILQLNIMKSGPRMEVLINDHQGQDLDILLIQEPSITTYPTHVNHSAWRLYRPTTQTDAVRFCSLVYVNRQIPTSSHRQIPCDHPDVAAIKIWTADSQTLLFSDYISPVPLFMTNDASAMPVLTTIENTITTAVQNEQCSTSIIITGDFN